MAAQDVGDLVPRVRRAIEGPLPLASGDPEYLDDDQVKALVADTVADIILLTEGEWGHQLVPQGGVPYTEWQVDPELSVEEESVIAAQAALTRFFHLARGLKTSERTRNESQEYEYQRSAQLLREQFLLLKDQRDRALAALQARTPVLARYASILATRDAVAAAVIEPWRAEGLRGGQEMARGSHWLTEG